MGNKRNAPRETPIHRRVFNALLFGGGGVGVLAYTALLGKKEHEGIELHLSQEGAMSPIGESQVVVHLNGGRSEDIQEIIVSPTEVTVAFKDGQQTSLSIPHNPVDNMSLPDGGTQSADDKVRVMLDIGKNTRRSDFKIRIKNPASDTQCMRLDLEIGAQPDAHNTLRQFEVDVSEARYITHLLLDQKEIPKKLRITGLREEQVQHGHCECQKAGHPNGDPRLPLGGTLTTLGVIKLITESPEQLKNDVILQDTDGKEHPLPPIDFITREEATFTDGAARRGRERTRLKNEFVRG